MQYSQRSVFFLVGILHLARSVHIELRYNKEECGPYGFRCLNDRMFEICAEFKRSDDSYSPYYAQDKLYPPIGSKALCPEGRECDKQNPLYCTSEREERYDHFKRKHKKKCDEQQALSPACDDQESTTQAPSSCDKDDGDDEGDDEEDECNEGAPEPDKGPCGDNKQPAVVFEESKQRTGAATASLGTLTPETGGQKKAGAPMYQIHSQGGKSCDKQASRDDASLDSSCSKSPGENVIPIPQAIFDESSNPQGAQDFQNSPAEDNNYNLFVGDVPDMTSTQPSDSLNNQSWGDYPCARAGNFPDPKDGKKYFFCDIDNSGEGYVASHKTCRRREVFNPALRECIPIENLHADTKRWASQEPFKCVKAGDFPDPNDCHKYYTCDRDDDSCGGCVNTFKMVHNCCPEDTMFDKILLSCRCTVEDSEDKDKRASDKSSKRCGDDGCNSPSNNCGKTCSSHQDGGSCGGSDNIEVIPTCSPPQEGGSCGDADNIEVIPTCSPPKSSGHCDGSDRGSDDDSDGSNYEDGPQVPDEPEPDDDGDDEPECSQRCSSHSAMNRQKQHHFKCHGEGKFADPYNCTTFLVCHPKRAEGGFHKLRFNCPTGKVFDQASQKCVPSNAREDGGSNCNRGIHD